MTPKQLEAHIKAANMTKTMFAGHLGVTLRTLQRWLSGQHPIPKWMDSRLK